MSKPQNLSGSKRRAGFAALAALIFGAGSVAVLAGKAPSQSTGETASERPFLDLLFGRGSDYPSEPVTILVPAAPGGGWDQLARVMQHVYVGENILGVPLEVENRGGAGGTVGLAEVVTQQRRNPYLLMIGGKTMVSAILLHDSRFTINDATPLALLATEYSVVAVPAASPYHSLDDLLADFRTDPSGFVWGGGAAGGADHLLIGQIAKSSGVDPGLINFVAYSGGGESATAILSGQVDAAVGGPEWRELADAGRIRFLAVSSPERLPGVNAPTLRESGLDIAMDNWRFVAAPPGITENQKDILIESLQRMHDSPRWSEMLRRQGLSDRFMTGHALDAFMLEETENTASLLRDLKIGDGDRSYTAAGPYLFPGVILAITLLSGAVLLFTELRKHASRDVKAEEAATGERGGPPVTLRSFGQSAGYILAYILALPLVGFLVATPIFFMAQARLIGARSMRGAIITGAVFTILVYVVFERLLSINVP